MCEQRYPGHDMQSIVCDIRSDVCGIQIVVCVNRSDVCGVRSVVCVGICLLVYCVYSRRVSVLAMGYK